MHRFTERFAEYCENNLNLEESVTYNYHSLSVCIIDCVYSLRARYYEVTIPVVDRYAKRYMNGNRNASGDTASMLIRHIEEFEERKDFAGEVLENHQKLSGNIPKEDTCYWLAKYLKYLNIETPEDFRDFQNSKSQELLETVVRAVKGIGSAGANYLFMLAGDPSRCKPDVHIRRCVKEVCGSELKDEEYQILFEETVKILKEQYPNLTVRSLDGIIWRKYQAKSIRSNSGTA